MLNQILRPVTRNVVLRGSRAYHPPEGWRQTTLSDCPVPQGSWQTHYDAKQKKYNIHLLIGVVTFIGTMAFAKASDLIYLNAAPPPAKK